MIMKRYEEFGSDAHLEETIDGEWVKFTDHQAEIAKRDELLARCLDQWAAWGQLWRDGLWRPIDQELQDKIIATIKEKAIAQKNNI